MKFTDIAAALAAVLLSACGGSDGSGSTSNSGGSSSTSGSGGSETSSGVSSNVMAVSVNGSLCDDATTHGSSGDYVNKPCVQVTVCDDAGSCVAVKDVLLDTGSYGLRIFEESLSGLSLSSTVVDSRTGATLQECAYFAEGTTLWGPVKSAKVILGDEDPVTVPIQVAGSTDGNPCVTGYAADLGFEAVATPVAAGFHGVLGIGPSRYDCGSGCVTQTSSTALDLQYYWSCTGSGSSIECAETTATLAQQVANPVALLSRDGNGYIIELPAVAATGAASASGSLILGVDTRDDNVSSSSATAFALDDDFYFVATGSSSSAVAAESYWAFLDTGSNGLFLPQRMTGLPVDSSGWYTPASTVSLVATFMDYPEHVDAKRVSYEIGSLLGRSAADMVFDDLGGDGGDSCDWGLPFFFGKTVYTWFPDETAGTGAFFAF